MIGIGGSPRLAEHTITLGHQPPLALYAMHDLTQPTRTGDTATQATLAIEQEQFHSLLITCFLFDGSESINH